MFGMNNGNSLPPLNVFWLTTGRSFHIFAKAREEAYKWLDISPCACSSLTESHPAVIAPVAFCQTEDDEICNQEHQPSRAIFKPAFFFFPEPSNECKDAEWIIETRCQAMTADTILTSFPQRGKTPWWNSQLSSSQRQPFSLFLSSAGELYPILNLISKPCGPNLPLSRRCCLPSNKGTNMPVLAKYRIAPSVILLWLFVENQKCYSPLLSQTMQE